MRHTTLWATIFAFILLGGCAATRQTGDLRRSSDRCWAMEGTGALLPPGRDLPRNDAAELVWGCSDDDDDDAPSSRGRRVAHFLHGVRGPATAAHGARDRLLSILLNAPKHSPPA